MSKIRCSLKRLKGGIKGHMEQLLLTIGGIALPFGLYLMAEYSNMFILGAIAAVAGFACWIVAGVFLQGKEAKGRKDNRQIRELLTNIHKELQKLNEGKK